MIQLTIRFMRHKAILTVPAEYDRMKRALWTLGLDQDPEKYTLRQLGAEFSATTEVESHMVQVVDPGNNLKYAMYLLSEMMYPPYPLAERIHKKMAAGEYTSEEDFFIEMEGYTYNSKVQLHDFPFPVSGTIVNKRGLMRNASNTLLLKYEHLIYHEFHRVLGEVSCNDRKLFEDVDGVYQKLLRASWSVDSLGGELFGQVILFLTEPLTAEEAKSAARKIEEINSTLLRTKLKNWSVLTDVGPMCVYMCNEDGDYSLFDSEMEDDEDEYDGPCICPECQELMRKHAASAGAELYSESLEDQAE